MIGRLIDLARPARRRESGASAVEFGLIAPVLLLLVFGIMSFGILFAQTLALNNAARQGARFGAVGNRTCTAMIAETRANAQALAMNPSSVVVEVWRGDSLAGATQITSSAPCNAPSPGNTACAGSTATTNVYVKAYHDSKLLIPIPLFPNTITVGGTGAFKCEYQ